MAVNKPSEMKTETKSKYDYKSLADFIKEELKGEMDVAKKVQKIKLQADKDRVKQLHDAEVGFIKTLAQLQNTLESNGLTMTNAQKKRFLIDYEKQRQNAEKKSILEYWKSFGLHARKEQQDEQKLLDRQLKVYQKVADIRAQADEKSQKVLKNQEKINEINKKIQKASESGNTKRVEKLQEQLKALTEENKKLKKDAKKLDKEADKEEKKESSREGFSDVFKEAFKDFRKEREEGPGETLGKDLLNTMKGVGKAIEDGLNEVNNAIKSYADYQTAINARMQGARGDTVEIFGQLEDNLRKVSFSPLIRTEELYDNLSTLIAEGISANVEQRAFLQTVKDGVATTFDANNSALKRIIRLQQYDSTAARLGMEAYLTAYLNELTQNTEYLQSTFDSVAESLVEASSLMTAQASTEFEYVIQKWLGTLTGLGLNESTATNIASAVGYLGSGNINALSSSDMQNLLVMASSRSGLNFSDLLAQGLTADTANQIMYNIITYMSEMGSDKNNVVKSQLAQTFGVTVSDLVAAKNIVQDNAMNTTITNLYNNLLTYNDMYTELGRQLGTLSEREGIANILENLFSNFTYSTGMGIASNPAMYATWKITDMIQGVTGGINIPYISAFGTGLDLNTTVENLVKLGIVGISTLGGIGDIISGFNSLGDASSMLSLLGIGANADTNTIVRGTGYNTRASGVGTSISTMIGNANGEDYATSALTSAEDSQQEKIDSKKEDKTSIDELNEYMQGEQKELYEEMREDVRALNNKIDEGITVRLYGYMPEQFN